MVLIHRLPLHANFWVLTKADLVVWQQRQPHGWGIAQTWSWRVGTADLWPLLGVIGSASLLINTCLAYVLPFQWIMKLICFIFWQLFLDDFQSGNGVPFVAKQFNNGLVVRYSAGFRHSLQFTGIWYCWNSGILSCQKLTQKMSGSASFTFFCSTHLGKAVWSRNTAVLKRDHLLSAVSWVKNKGSEVLRGSHKALSRFWSSRPLNVVLPLFPIGNRASLVGKPPWRQHVKADRGFKLLLVLQIRVLFWYDIILDKYD